MKYIKDLHEGDIVSGTYLCKEKRNLMTKAGNDYFSLALQDKTGNLDGKVWKLHNGIEEFDAMEYIHVEGRIVSFQGALQLNIERVRKVSIILLILCLLPRRILKKCTVKYCNILAN